MEEKDAITQKPDRKPAKRLRAGKEETSLENKKHRSAMIRFGKVVSDAPAAKKASSDRQRFFAAGRRVSEGVPRVRRANSNAPAAETHRLTGRDFSPQEGA